jgi:hypothetical protein
MARFFTILTMVLVVIAFVTVADQQDAGLSAPDACGPDPVGRDDRAVYHGLLAEFWNPTGLGIVADIGLHTIVPVAVTFCGGCSTRPRRR